MPPTTRKATQAAVKPAPEPEAPTPDPEPTPDAADAVDGAHAPAEDTTVDFCPEPGACFPLGIPADTASAGCVHGTWDFTE